MKRRRVGGPHQKRLKDQKNIKKNGKLFV